MKSRFSNLLGAVAFGVFANAAVSLHAQNFLSASTNLSLGGPNSLAVADVNGDGRLDLISPNGSGNALLVFTNKGNGTFGAAVSFQVGSGPYGVAVADVNRDGKVDLISANAGGNTLTVLTNNGSGGFASNATYFVGNSPRSVIAADIDGSGKLALVCANYNDGTLTVLTNNGNGGFGSNASYNVGTHPISVIALDINGRGRPALICASYFPSDTLSIYTNNGNGVFGSNATINVGASIGVSSVVTADIFGTGRLALVCANYFDHSLFVFTNNGTGHFTSNTAVNAGLSVTWGAAADLNGDGKADLIAVRNYGDSLVVFTNDGTGRFASNANYTVGRLAPGSGNDYPVFALAADLNGDGRMDLIAANLFDNTLSVLTNAWTFPAAGAVPALAIRRSGNGVLVTWPAIAAGWSLQQASTAGGSPWLPSGYNGYGVADDGTNQSLTVNPLFGNTYFRLIHP